MSKPSIVTSTKSVNLPSKSAWSRGPPSAPSPTASSPRSQSPAPQSGANTPTHATHSRRASNLGVSVPVKDGVSVPRSNAGAAKQQGSAVSFGSIDDVSAPAAATAPPQPTPPTTSAPPTKAEIMKNFTTPPPSKEQIQKGFTTVPQGPGHVNGKSSISTPVSSSTSQKASPAPTPSTSTSTLPPSTPSKPIGKVDIAKLFQGSGSTSSAPPTSSASASPSIRPASLPMQQHQQGQHTQSPSHQHHQLPPTPSSQPSQLGPHGYTPFVPRSQPPQNAPGSPAGMRAPSYPRQMPGGPNGSGPRPGTSGPPGGNPGPNQMSPSLSSPRLSNHPHQPHPHQPPSGMPPQPQVPIPNWPGYYYAGMPPEQQYMPYSNWYGPPMPQQQQHPHPQHQHHPLPPGPPGQSPMGMHMSPRNPPSQLHPPGTPGQSHALPQPHPVPPSHSTANNIGQYSSPPATPSSSNTPMMPRLNTNANAFVPGRASKGITIKNPDGLEVKLDAFAKHVPPVTPSSPAPAFTPISGHQARKSIVRMESEDQRKKRIEEEEAREKEKERAKKEAEEKVLKEKEEAEKKVREEEERLKKEEEDKEKERLRLEEEEKEKVRKAEEEERLKKEKEEQERLEKELEAQKESERIRLEAEEAERKKKEEEEQARLEAEKEKERHRLEEEAKAAAAKAEAEAPPAVEEKEEGEVDEKLDDVEEKLANVPEEVKAEAKAEAADKVADKMSGLRIDTAAAPQPLEMARRRPGPLDLSYTQKMTIPPSLPSALATARIIDDINTVQYPSGIMSPKVELNNNAKDGKFRYDREFLLQFMSICKEKPDMLPPLDAIGLEPTDQSSFSMSRGGSGRHRTSSAAGAPPNVRSTSQAAGLGFSGFGMGNFTSTSKMTSDERFQMASGRTASIGSPAQMGFNRQSPMVRSASQGGPGQAGMGSGRTRSKRGEKRGDANKGGGGQQGGHGGYNQGPSNAFGNMGPPGGMFEPVAPLESSANRWVPVSTSKKAPTIDADSPEMVDRKVKSLLNKLTMEKFDSISDQVIAWANKSEKEKDGRTLIQVIRLVFEKATDEATWSEMYARLCRKMMEQISPKVQDDGIKNAEGKPIAGGQLFRKYLLNRCQEDFEHGWINKEATAAAAKAKSAADEALKAQNESNKEANNDEEIALYSEEYYTAQKAKRRGLGLIKFIGELFKLQMLTERIMHECVKKLLGNVENPEEEEIESLCQLLGTVGALLDTPKAKAHMDVYFSRMKELGKSQNVSSRMQFMLQDIIELRERKWVSRNLVATPATIAQIHEAAAKEKANQAQEAYQRQMSMSRGNSRRGGDRNGGEVQVGPDGWAVAGGGGPPRPPPKAGDLSNFGKINKAAPMTFGPTSVFSKKEGGSKRDSLPRVNSNANMFSMLSAQNPEMAAEVTAPKGSLPPSRKTSIDLGPGGAPEAAVQRKRLQLLPRSKPQEDAAATATSEAGSEEEPVAVEGMSEADAAKRIGEDSKEFFAVRNLEEAEEYFPGLTPEHRFRLVEKLVSKAIESKQADAQLVGDFFAIAASKNLCSPEAFEEGFTIVAEMLDDIAIDAPKAFDLMAIMLKGSGLDEERRTRVALKSIDSDKLLAMLS